MYYNQYEVVSGYLKAIRKKQHNRVWIWLRICMIFNLEAKCRS